MVRCDARAGGQAACRHRLPPLFRGSRPLASLVLLGLLVAGAAGQRPNVHYFQRADMPPGSIGRAQLLRGGPLACHMQPVEISAPDGVQIALSIDGLFDAPQPAPARVGMLVGRVYRLKVINIPNYEGQEVYPSVEIINRLYTPVGREHRFPIPIQLTQEELRLALQGRFVTRVIYLENPRAALPERQDPERQRYWEVGAHQDPLQVADRLGRPMAILRLGSRVPEPDQITGRFLFDSPPWIRLPEPTPAAEVTAGGRTAVAAPWSRSVPGSRALTRGTE